MGASLLHERGFFNEMVRMPADLFRGDDPLGMIEHVSLTEPIESEVLLQWGRTTINRSPTDMRALLRVDAARGHPGRLTDGFVAPPISSKLQTWVQLRGHTQQYFAERRAD